MWDVVLDHDNLTKSIDLAVERIEKSKSRGQECLLYSELEDYDYQVDFDVEAESNAQRLPKVFAMRDCIHLRNGSEPSQDMEIRKNRHYPPASDDPQQFVSPSIVPCFDFVLYIFQFECSTCLVVNLQ